MWGNDVGAHAIRPARSPSWPGLLRARWHAVRIRADRPSRIVPQRFPATISTFSLPVRAVRRTHRPRHMLAARSHRFYSLHTRHVNGHHMLVTLAAIRSKEYGERRRMRVQLRRHVGAGQLRETHMHVGVVRDGSLSARHRHHAVFDENDLRVRLQQRRVEQVGFVASRNLIVDVALRKWQERQCLSQRQW